MNKFRTGLHFMAKISIAKRPNSPAGPVASFKNNYFLSGLGQLSRCNESRRARTDDQNLGLFCLFHVQPTIVSFSSRTITTWSTSVEVCRGFVSASGRHKANRITKATQMMTRVSLFSFLGHNMDIHCRGLPQKAVNGGKV